MHPVHALQLIPRLADKQAKSPVGMHPGPRQKDCYRGVTGSSEQVVAELKTYGEQVASKASTQTQSLRTLSRKGQTVDWSWSANEIVIFPRGIGPWVRRVGLLRALGAPTPDALGCPCSSARRSRPMAWLSSSAFARHQMIDCPRISNVRLPSHAPRLLQLSVNMGHLAPAQPEWPSSTPFSSLSRARLQV